MVELKMNKTLASTIIGALQLSPWGEVPEVIRLINLIKLEIKRVEVCNGNS